MKLLAHTIANTLKHLCERITRHSMSLGLYNIGLDAGRVDGYPWATWTSLREAWEVAEHYEQTYSDKFKMYAALLVDTEASDAGRGRLALGGKTAPHHLNITNGKPDDPPR